MIVAVSLVIMGLIYESINSLTKIKFNRQIPVYFYIIPSFLLLFFISAFRGDFTTDYKNYSDRFQSVKYYSFSELLKYDFKIETGYLVFNKLINFFTDDHLYLFIITTLIILICFYYQLRKYSVNVWLSVLMFVTVGSYYVSFNITRQIMTAGIIFMGSKYLYERKFFRYVFVVLTASLFHQTALIMIPFYFILNLKINFKNISLVTIGSVVIAIFFDNILSFTQTIAYSNYTDSSYGMTGASIGNAVLPVAFAVFALLHVKKLDPNNNMHRVWFNATFFYAVFRALSLQVLMVERISYYMASYTLLLIPFLFLKMKNKHLRFIYTMVLIATLILYNYIVFYDSVFNPYYFVWE